MKQDTIDALAQVAGKTFESLKSQLLSLEALGVRPIVITHPNGMLDTMRVDPPHATTPAVDEIRTKKRIVVDTHATHAR
jgi:hypothetical protein